MKTRNRIVGHDTVPAETLKANPLNWRDHPERQAIALNQALDTLGWVKRVLVNKRTGLIIDGHLRVEEAAKRGESVPVLYVNLTPREEAIVLATLDPLAEEAGTDTEKLHALLDDMKAEFSQIDELLREIANDAGISLYSDEKPPENQDHDPILCPRCGHGWQE